MNEVARLDRSGLFAAVGAYSLWGVFPLYWYLLKHVPSVQIIAHRVLWCGLFVLLYLLLRGQLSGVREALRRPGVLPWLLLSSLLISLNWGVYIWAVTHGHVVEASLGYFINPLVSVLLAVCLLGERLNHWQWAAVLCAALGVAWLTFKVGSLPWIALTLAFSFAFYGLIRKHAAVDAVPGLAIESLILWLPSLAWLLYAQADGVGAFAGAGLGQDLLLILGGGLTALPLIGFAYGARRIPYSLVGLLQYIAPTLQLACGLWLLGESLHAGELIGYVCIWAGLALYAGDGWRRSRANARQRRILTANPLESCPERN